MTLIEELYAQHKMEIDSYKVDYSSDIHTPIFMNKTINDPHLQLFVKVGRYFQSLANEPVNQFISNYCFLLASEVVSEYSSVSINVRNVWFSYDKDFVQYIHNGQLLYLDTANINLFKPFLERNKTLEFSFSNTQYNASIDQISEYIRQEASAEDITAFCAKIYCLWEMKNILTAEPTPFILGDYMHLADQLLNTELTKVDAVDVCERLQEAIYTYLKYKPNREAPCKRLIVQLNCSAEGITGEYSYSSPCLQEELTRVPITFQYTEGALGVYIATVANRFTFTIRLQPSTIHFYDYSILRCYKHCSDCPGMEVQFHLTAQRGCAYDVLYHEDVPQEYCTSLLPHKTVKLGDLTIESPIYLTYTDNDKFSKCTEKG